MVAPRVPADSDTRARDFADGQRLKGQLQLYRLSRSTTLRFPMSKITRRDLLTSVPALALGGLAVAEPPTADTAAPRFLSSVATRLIVNGKAHALELDPRTTVLDALREHLQPHGHQERMRSGPVRRLHRAHWRRARAFVPHPRCGDAAIDPSSPSRAWRGPVAACIRCSGHSSNRMAFSADTARPGKSCPRSPASQKVTPPPMRTFAST